MNIQLVRSGYKNVTCFVKLKQGSHARVMGAFKAKPKDFKLWILKKCLKKAHLFV